MGAGIGILPLGWGRGAEGPQFPCTDWTLCSCSLKAPHPSPALCLLFHFCWGWPVGSQDTGHRSNVLAQGLGQDSVGLSVSDQGLPQHRCHHCVLLRVLALTGWLLPSADLWQVQNPPSSLLPMAKAVTSPVPSYFQISWRPLPPLLWVLASYRGMPPASFPSSFIPLWAVSGKGEAINECLWFANFYQKSNIYFYCYIKKSTYY